MSLIVSIDTESKTPHYEQLRAQIAALITTRQLPNGTRLPTVHALANDLGLAKGTVARAYQDLERAHLVTSARRRGTSVTAPPATIEQTTLADAAAHFAAVATTHGLDASEAHDLLTAALIRQLNDVPEHHNTPLPHPTNPRRTVTLSTTTDGRERPGIRGARSGADGIPTR